MGQGWETMKAHLLGTLTQPGRDWQTRCCGPSAQDPGSSNQGDKAHSLLVWMPPALTERCQEGRGRPLLYLDTSDQEDMDGL